MTSEQELILFFIMFASLCLICGVAYSLYNIFYGDTCKAKTITPGQNYYFKKTYYGKHNGRFVITAGVPVKKGVVFTIVRKKTWHRFLAFLRLAQDLTTGDATIDKAFYFMTDDEQKLKTLLGSQVFITALREIFDTYRAQTVQCTNSKLWFDTLQMSSVNFKWLTKQQAKDIWQNPDEPAFAEQAAHLATEVEKLNTSSYMQPNASSFPLSRAAGLLKFIHVALLIVGPLLTWSLFFRSEEVVNNTDFIITAVSASFIVMLLWFALVVYMFGRTSWFPQVCGSFISCGIIGLLFLTSFIMWETDIDLDHTQPEMKSLPLQGKECSLYCGVNGSGSQKSTYILNDRQCTTDYGATLISFMHRDNECRRSSRFNYYLYFPSPIAGIRSVEPQYKLVTRQNIYAEVHLGQPFTFSIHKGALGLPWTRPMDIHTSQ